jgi:hypothetical protein
MLKRFKQYLLKISIIFSKHDGNDHFLTVSDNLLDKKLFDKK